ncbi:MAG: toprim domain-containing protein, partial [Sphaerochaetaceae bacterium]
SSGAYNGLFHVLGGALSPLDGIGPDKLDFTKLLKRIKEGSFTEIIIATNPTEEGDTTAMYLRHLLKGSSLSITRLASGLPIGGDLEYADRLTLARSLRGRIDFKGDS